eukprot:194261_1
MPFNFSLSSVLGTALGYKFVPKGTKKRKHRIRNYVDTFNRKYGASLNDLQKNSEMHISLGTIRDKETLRSNPELQRKKITEKIKKAAKADTFDDAWINHVEVMQSGVIYNTKDFPIILDTAEESCCGETSMETIHTPTQGAATAGASEEEEEEEDADTDEEDTHCESQAIQSMVEAMQDKLDEAYTERMMTIPQLEISTAPKSTANITNLSEEELKMNPQLYKMYSYYIPFAHRGTASSAPPPLNTPTTPPTPPNPHHHRSNMGPRRRNPNFLKPQLVGDEIYPRSHSYSPNKHRNLINTAHGHAHSHSPIRTVGSAKLVPIGNVKPNPLDIEKKGKKHTEPHIAPAHANVQSVISPNGGIYHPCHGYSQRDISIFDLFPGIVKYQSKKYAECDRVDYLVSLSEKSFCSVNNKPLKVNEAEMWYTALKYLFNDITLGQFDYMSVEMRYVIKQYMSTHKNRLSFLKSIKSYGFLRVISDVSKKLPREHIQKIMKQEREKKEKQEREKLVALQKQIRYQQLIQQQQMYQQQLYQQHEATHYADWYTGSKLKRTVSEPPPLTASYKPCIVDEEDDDIDDSWNFITEIVNNNKIPDLPPEREHTHSSSPSTHTSDDDEAKEQEEMNEIVDVYTMLYQTMKDKEGPDVSLADLTTIEQHDTFTPKLPFKWCTNAHSPSIWMDNPYAKPSKYFKSKKSKYKRGK